MFKNKPTLHCRCGTELYPQEVTVSVKGGKELRYYTIAASDLDALAYILDNGQPLHDIVNDVIIIKAGRCQTED